MTERNEKQKGSKDDAGDTSKESTTNDNILIDDASEAASTVYGAQTEASLSPLEEPGKGTTPSYKKRKGTNPELLSTGVEDDFEQGVQESQESKRPSKRAKKGSNHEDRGDDDDGKRIRKVSKVEMQIAEGKAPEKGSHEPKGELRIWENGLMEFRDAENPEWTPAAYHEDYRREFIAKAAQDGRFDIAPTRGEAKYDETSFEPNQQSWGPSREDWQNIVNSEGEKVMFRLERPASSRPPQEPGNWTYQGLTLLDQDNHPVRDWPGLNMTLSSEIESWRWEALMRLYPWLSVADLIARMPHRRMKNKGKFWGNPRYVISTDDSPQSPPASIKRKSQSDDDNDYEFENDDNDYEFENDDNDYELENDDDNLEPLFEDSELFYDPTKMAEQWDDPEQDDYHTYPTETWVDQNDEHLVPLFATVDDLGLAMVENENWTTPAAVIRARRDGNQQTRQIDLYWYDRNVPRQVGADGNVVNGVVNFNSRHLYQAEEDIPGDIQGTPQDDSTQDAPQFSTLSIIPATVDPSLGDASVENSQASPTPALNQPQATASSSSQTAQSVPRQVGRYQTESDTAEEVWRNHYGPSGF